MLDDLHVRVISFSSDPPLLAKLRTLFPTSSVSVQPAVDVRGIDTQTLLAGNLIGHSGANSITQGRRWHHELPNKGGVGLAHAVRLALLEDPSRNLLLFEEDCAIRDEARLLAYVRTLATNAPNFDIAVMGTLHTYQTTKKRVDGLPDWVHLEDMFWGLHCVMYPAHSRSKIAAVLDGRLDMQIDSLYGSMAKNDLLKVWGQVDNPCVYQEWHVSGVQDMKTLPIVINTFTALRWGTLAIVIGVLMGMAATYFAMRASRR